MVYNKYVKQEIQKSVFRKKKKNSYETIPLRTTLLIWIQDRYCMSCDGIKCK